MSFESKQLSDSRWWRKSFKPQTGFHCTQPFSITIPTYIPLIRMYRKVSYHYSVSNYPIFDEDRLNSVGVITGAAQAGQYTPASFSLSQYLRLTVIYIVIKRIIIEGINSKTKKYLTHTLLLSAIKMIQNDCLWTDARRPEPRLRIRSADVRGGGGGGGEGGNVVRRMGTQQQNKKKTLA